MICNWYIGLLKTDVPVFYIIGLYVFLIIVLLRVQIQRKRKRALDECLKILDLIGIIDGEKQIILV